MRRLVFEAATTRFRPTRLTYVLRSTRLEEASYRQVDYYVQGMRLLYTYLSNHAADVLQ